MNPGERIGPYELDERIGKGGMGEVWRARDLNLGRAVAIKFLLNQTPEDLARFRREGRIVARLAHPAIAALYDVGDDLDRPYIVMQFVEGAPLDEAPLTLAAKVRALAHAARGVHHAHAQGVLHRDLKPANILVDVEGRGIVLDFGLARETRKPAGGTLGTLSLTGDIFGTPAYMPPEQARGELQNVTARSDVYGLGAALYNLLAGHGPHQGADAYEIIHSVLFEDPAPPTGDPDLATICLKAIDRDPRRRYATAAEFADDLERWLRGEAVVARPPSFAYRLSKRIRRRPVAWALGAAAAACALAATAFVGVQAVKKSDALIRIRDHEAEARVAESRRRGRNELLGLLHAFNTRVNRLDDQMARRLEPDELAKVRTSLVDEWQKLDAALRRHPDEGVLYYLRGRVRRMLGDKAPDDFQRAIDHAHTEWGAAGHVAARASFERFRTTLDSLIEVLSMGLEEYVGISPGEVFQRLQQDADRIDSVGLSRPEAAVVTFWRDYNTLATREQAYRKIGEEIDRGGNTAELLASRGLALVRDGRRREDALRDIDASLERYDGHGSVHFTRGVILLQLKRQDEARRAFDRALALDPGNFTALMNRGSTSANLGDLEAALADFEAVVREQQDNPIARENLAHTLLTLGRIDDALKEFDATLKIVPEFAKALVGRAQCRRRRHDLKSARRDLDDAIRLSPEYKEAFLDRGLVGDDEKDFEAALGDLDRAVAIDPHYAQAWAHRGNVLRELGRLDEAIQSCDRALKIQPGYARALAHRGAARSMAGDQDGALKDLDAALAGKDAFPDAYNWRGIVKARLDEHEDALADFTEAIRRAPNSGYYTNRARSLKALRRWGEAADDLRAALERMPPDAPQRAAVERDLKSLERLNQGGEDF